MQACAPVLAAVLLLVASCNVLVSDDGGEAREGNVQLYPLQIAVEEALGTAESHVGGATAVAVVAVVDSTALGGDSAESASADDAATGALRRERVVRNELNSSLVRNSLIDVVQPDQAVIELARAGIIANNSAALSESLVGQLGEMLHAEIVICAVVDLEGKEVSIAAQDVADGRLVYHETIVDWKPRTGEEAAAVE